jgi:hypothetical protein
MDSQNTIPRPLGGETYQEIKDSHGKPITLTYNDMWMMIVCQQTMDGDWVRLREAATMVADAQHKREIVERLWKLEQALGGLPDIPGPIAKLHLHRAHVWFNQRPVNTGRNW